MEQGIGVVPSISAQQELQLYEGTQFSLHPNFEELRLMQEKWVSERDWDQFHTPRNLVLALVGEVGELAECFQWKFEVRQGLPGWTEKEKEHLGEEMSDVLLYLLRLADKCNIDLPNAAVRKIQLNAVKYPAKYVQGSAKKYTEYSSSSSSEALPQPPLPQRPHQQQEQ